MLNILVENFINYKIELLVLFNFFLALSFFSGRSVSTIAKLLFYLQIVFLSRSYLISFFTAPTIDFFDLLYVFLLNILILNLYQVFRLIVALEVIKNYEQLVVNLLVKYSKALRFIVFFYFLLVVLGLFFEPKVFHFIFLLILSVYLLQEKSLVKSMDRLLLMLLTPSSLIFLIVILQFNIFLYPFLGYFLTFALLNKSFSFVALMGIVDKGWGVSLVEMTIVPEPIITAAKEVVTQIAKNSTKLNQVAREVPESFVFTAGRELQIKYLQNALQGKEKICHVIPYFKTVFDYNSKSFQMLPEWKVLVKDLSFLQESVVKQNAVELILKQPGIFMKHVTANLEKVLVSRESKIFMPLIETKLGLELVQKADLFKCKELLLNLPYNVDPLTAKSLLTVDLQQIYASQNPVVNLNNALDKILRSFSPEGAFEMFNDYSGVHKWLVQQQADKVHIMRGPLGDFNILLEARGQYKFYIIESKTTPDVGAVLKQTSANMAHKERVEQHNIFKYNIEKALNTKNVPQEFVVVASKGPYKILSAEEIRILNKVSLNVMKTLKADFTLDKSSVPDSLGKIEK